jgi:hypothetical protein
LFITYNLVYLVVSFSLALSPICFPLHSHSYYMHCPSHPPLLDHPNYTSWRVQVMELQIMQLFPPSRRFIPLRPKHCPQHPVLEHPQSVFLPLSLFCPNIVLSTLFVNTLSLCSCLNVRDQISHPYRPHYVVNPKYDSTGEHVQSRSLRKY